MLSYPIKSPAQDRHRWDKDTPPRWHHWGHQTVVTEEVKFINHVTLLEFTNVIGPNGSNSSIKMSHFEGVVTIKRIYPPFSADHSLPGTGTGLSKSKTLSAPLNFTNTRANQRSMFKWNVLINKLVLSKAKLVCFQLQLHIYWTDTGVVLFFSCISNFPNKEKWLKQFVK